MRFIFSSLTVMSKKAIKGKVAVLKEQLQATELKLEATEQGLNDEAKTLRPALASSREHA